MFNMQLARCALVIFVVFACTRSVHASPVFDLGGDTIGTGGLQARTVPGSAAAAYFNPALLSDVPAGFTVGFSLLDQGISISLDGRPGTQFAVPDSISTAGRMDGSRFDNYPIGTNLLQFGRMMDARRVAFLARPRQAAGSGHDVSTREVVGLVVKAFDGRFTLGLHTVVPNGQFTRMRAFFNDEREQYFSNSLHPELYSDRMAALSLALAVGIKLTDQLSIGAGATIALKTDVIAGAYVADTGDLGNILLNIDAPVNVGVSPHFGVSYRPLKRLRLSATLHTVQKVELASKFTFLLANGVEQASGVKFVLDYNPWKISLGGAYDIVDEADQSLSVSASLLYARWSDYVDRHGFAPTPAYAWSDTLSPTVGARYRLASLTTFADLAFTPTPVPPQTGRSNYVDNDRFSTSLGGEYGFRLWNTGFKVGAQVQWHQLIRHSQTKLPTPTTASGEVVAPERVKDEVPDDAQIGGEPLAAAPGLQTNNPGWPGFSSGGRILGGTVFLAIEF
jgi:long-chain fatty acid transport protein